MAQKTVKNIFITVFLTAFFCFLYTSSQNVHFVKRAGDVFEYELKSNGLRVLILEDHSAPVVTLMAACLAGLGKEVDRPKQVAHLLEHMLMKSTKNYNYQNNNPQSRVLQNIGAVINATTEEDKTIYYATLPSSELPLALDIQADRIRNALFNEDDVAREKKVVQDELYGLANSPEVLLSERVWKKAFRRHPYGNGSAGARFEVERLTKENLREFYDTYYWPNNTVLILAGDFDPKNVLELIDKKFAGVPKSPKLAPDLKIKEPEQKGARRALVFANTQTEMISVSHKIPPATHPDFIPLQVLGEILTSGRTSRLYQPLIESELAVGMGSELPQLREGSLITISASLAFGVRHKEALKAILAVYDKIKKDGISEEELNRAKEKMRVKTIFAKDGSFAVANQIADAVSFGDWTFSQEYLDRLKKVTSKEVGRVAKTYLVPEKMTVGFLSSGKKHNPKLVKIEPKSALKTLKPVTPISQDKLSAETISSIDWKRPIANQAFTKTIRGIKMIGIKTDVKGFVTVAGAFDGMGKAFEEKPLVSDMTISMLGRATKQYSIEELVQILDEKGIQISFSFDYKRLNFEIHSLKENLATAIQVLASELLEPVFEETEFQKLKKQQKIQILESMQDSFERGYLEFKRLIYKKGDPNYLPSYEEQLESLETLKLSDIETFYKGHSSFKNFTIIFVGDINPSMITNALNESFRNLKINDIPIPYSSVVRPSKPMRKLISIKGKNGIELFLGHEAPLNQSRPDYLPAMVANFVLGGDFSARLMNEVREKRGLTYHIISNFGGIAGEDLEGHWVVNLTAKPEFYKQAIEETKKQIKLFVDKGILKEELEQRKSTLVGKFKVDLATTEGLVKWILRNEELGFDLNHFDEYPNRVNRLKLEEVNHAIRHYIRPEHLSEVIVGDVKE